MAAAIVGLLLIGCSSGGHGTGSKSATPAFTPTLETAPPEIQQFLQRLGTLRQLGPPKDLKVGMVPRSAVPALLQSLTSQSDVKSMQKTTVLYRLLGHLRPDQAYQSVYDGFIAQALVGLYSPKDKALWVVHPDGQPTDFKHLSTNETQAVVHELVHALQDAHFDLQEVADRTGGSLDLSLAATTVIEGDAVSTQRNYSAKYAFVPDGGGILLADLARPSDSTPASIQRELLFPYTEGSDWIDSIRAKGGNAAVDALLKNPPKGTVYVFHPALLDSGWQPTRVDLPDLAGPVGAGWRKDSEGQFGEFELQNYLQLRLPGLDSVQAASGWQGDHYAVYVRGGSSVAVFRVAFGSVQDAQQFGAAQDELLNAAGARKTNSEGMFLETENSGNTTIRLPGNTASVTFVIGSDARAALAAAKAVAHG